MSLWHITLNNHPLKFEAEDNMPLLWVIRDLLGLTGTKYGCGIGQCGNCSVLINNEAVRSCILPISAVERASIITIEGLSTDNTHAVQKAWIKEQVPQCGYCQSGQIINATALLLKNPDPNDHDIDEAMRGVLCRCGTYQRIRRAIHLAAKLAKEGK